MATSSAINNEPVSGASAAKVDMKFEVIVIPVADVDRSKAFYTKLGWRLDADFPFDNTAVQNGTELQPRLVKTGGLLSRSGP